MQYLTKRGRLLACLVAGLGVHPLAHAEGTDSGTVVTNSVSLSYEVNSVVQSGSASVAFTVDRKLNVDVVTQNADWVTAVPGQTATPGTANALDYLVANRSNDSAPVLVTLVDRSVQAITGFSALAGSPSAIPPAPATGTIWSDLNDDNLIDPGEVSAALNATGVTQLLLPAMAEDSTTNIKVVVDVDGTAVASQYRSFTLVAAIADGAGVALPGDNSGNAAPGGSATNVANDLNAVEIIFADAGSANPEDIQYDHVSGTALATQEGECDGQSADTSGFITLATLALGKHVEVLYDPISENAYNGSGASSGNTPKSIPGAVLLYVIGVSNITAGLSAVSVAIDDDVPDSANEVLVGDQANPGAAIDLPTSVTFDVGGSPTTITLDRTSILTNLDQVWVKACSAASATAQAFGSGDPEIDDAPIGTCAAGETGYIAYLVTINDA